MLSFVTLAMGFMLSGVKHCTFSFLHCPPLNRSRSSRPPPISLLARVKKQKEQCQAGNNNKSFRHSNQRHAPVLDNVINKRNNHPPSLFHSSSSLSIERRNHTLKPVTLPVPQLTRSDSTKASRLRFVFGRPSDRHGSYATRSQRVGLILGSTCPDLSASFFPP